MDAPSATTTLAVYRAAMAEQAVQRSHRTITSVAGETTAPYQPTAGRRGPILALQLVAATVAAAEEHGVAGAVVIVEAMATAIGATTVRSITATAATIGAAVPTHEAAGQMAAATVRLAAAHSEVAVVAVTPVAAAAVVELPGVDTKSKKSTL
jgi:hypothetical protein